jgi:hypothetical protein
MKNRYKAVVEQTISGGTSYILIKIYFYEYCGYYPTEVVRRCVPSPNWIERLFGVTMERKVRREFLKIQRRVERLNSEDVKLESIVEDYRIVSKLQKEYEDGSI